MSKKVPRKSHMRKTSSGKIVPVREHMMKVNNNKEMNLGIKQGKAVEKLLNKKGIKGLNFKKLSDGRLAVMIKDNKPKTPVYSIYLFNENGSKSTAVSDTDKNFVKNFYDELSYTRGEAPDDIDKELTQKFG